LGESLKKHTIDVPTLIYLANSSRKNKQEVLEEAREEVELTLM